MLTRETLATLIDEVGLTDLKPKIMAMAKPAIRMISTPVEDESEIPIGASKLGGLPDMPSGAEYPTHKGKALGFVAQINLADLPDHPERHRLPSSGLLQLFYRDWFESVPDKSTEIWKSKLIYHKDDPDMLKRTPIPDSYEWEPYLPCNLQYHNELSIPAFESFFVKRDLGLSYGPENPNNDKYIKLSHRCWEIQKSKVFNRMFGHPHLVQGDVLAEAYSLTRGEWYISGTYDQPEFHEWELLVQIDSDNNANMMWGDVGILYYCIRKNDLDAGRFDNTVCVMQCG